MTKKERLIQASLIDVLRYYENDHMSFDEAIEKVADNLNKNMIHIKEQ